MTFQVNKDGKNFGTVSSAYDATEAVSILLRISDVPAHYIKNNKLGVEKHAPDRYIGNYDVNGEIVTVVKAEV
jgi:hypothetical protein